VVPSGFLREVFAVHGFAAQVVPNIVDLARFAPAPQRPFGARFLVARNLEPIYDNATALRAFDLVRKQLPQARLTVAGSGPELEALRSLAGELGLDAAVDFSGRQEVDAMAELYRRSDIVLNPALADNMPNSLLEAMASGVPVVTTDVGGIGFVVRDMHTALLVRPGAPVEMAAAALRLAADPGLRSQLIGAGLEAVAEYSWDQVRPKLFDVYRQCSGRAVVREALT
jgi:L-malate glycosyltransferase